MPLIDVRLTVDDIDTIIEGLDEFCIGPGWEDTDVAGIWQPYIDKLKELKAAVIATIPRCEAQTIVDRRSGDTVRCSLFAGHGGKHVVAVSDR